jgi:D-alanyl-D-alanine carboxypeptidase/D-alanyl-D-alanine-endopeptidase (penicillin-binding protein 4)
VDPPVDYLQVVNRARTGPAGERGSLRVERVAAGAHEQVVVAGTLPAGGEPHSVARSVADPTRYAGAVLAMQLSALGIAVDGSVQLGTAPAESELLHGFTGMPVSEIVMRFMKWSNNQIGEGLLKALALRDAAPQGSSAAARRELVRLGVPVEGLVLEDGSGLSYDDRVSPRTLVAALRIGRSSFGFGAELVGALPIAGIDGTLRDRASDARARVRAKTGLLTRVSALSGLAEDPKGEVLAFSVLVNGFRGSASGAMRALDRFVAELTRPE